MQEKQLKEPNEAARHVKSLLFARPAIMIRLLISGIVQQSSSVWRTHKRISPLSTDKSKSFGGQTKQKVSLVDFHVRQVARNFFADVTALYTVTRNGVSPFSRVFLYLFFFPLEIV